MENQADDTINLQESTLKTSKASTRSKLLFVILNIFLFLLFILVGVVSFKLTHLNQKLIYTMKQAPTSSQDELPPYLKKFSQDSAFSGWTAAVAGVLVKKDSNKFTIDPIADEYLPNGVHKIRLIPVSKPLQIYLSAAVNPTFYYQKSSTPSATPLPSISYDALKEGSVLRGSVGIYYQNNIMNFFAQSFVSSIIEYEK